MEGGFLEKGSVGNAMNEKNEMILELMEVIEVVGLFGDYRKTQRKECFSLVRRMKLLLPLLEEISEFDSLFPYQATKCLSKLRKAFISAKKLLKSCNNGSKIYLAIESEMIMGRFYSVYDKLNQALDGMPYEELGIGDELKEQVAMENIMKMKADLSNMELFQMNTQQETNNFPVIRFQRIYRESNRTANYIAKWVV